MSTKEQNPVSDRNPDAIATSTEKLTEDALAASPPTVMLDDRTKVREGYAQVGGATLHYIVAGEGPLIVPLHGFPEFWYGWLQIAPLAAAGFRVVAPDLRGHDLSSRPSTAAPAGTAQPAPAPKDLVLLRLPASLAARARCSSSSSPSTPTA